MSPSTSVRPRRCAGPARGLKNVGSDILPLEFLHKLLASLFDHVWQDNGTIVAVKPRPAFAGYFKAIDQARPKPPKADRKRGVTKAERRGSNPRSAPHRDTHEG